MSHRGFPITAQRREERRKQAEARQAEYDKLTLQQKLNRLPANGAKRQRTRLEAAINKQQQRSEQSAQVTAQNAAKPNNNQQKKTKEEK